MDPRFPSHAAAGQPAASSDTELTLGAAAAETAAAAQLFEDFAPAPAADAPAPLVALPPAATLAPAPEDPVPAGRGPIPSLTGFLLPSGHLTPVPPPWPAHLDPLPEPLEPEVPMIEISSDSSQSASSVSSYIPLGDDDDDSEDGEGSVAPSWSDSTLPSYDPMSDLEDEDGSIGGGDHPVPSLSGSSFSSHEPSSGVDDGDAEPMEEDPEEDPEEVPEDDPEADPEADPEEDLEEDPEEEVSTASSWGESCPGPRTFHGPRSCRGRCQTRPARAVIREVHEGSSCESRTPSRWVPCRLGARCGRLRRQW